MNEYYVYALQNKCNKKIFVNMTTDLQKPIVLKDRIVKEIIDSGSNKNDLEMFLLGEKLRFSKARDLMIKSIIEFKSYISDYGYNDFNERLKINFVPETVTEGKPEVRK